MDSLNKQQYFKKVPMFQTVLDFKGSPDYSNPARTEESSRIFQNRGIFDSPFCFGDYHYHYIYGKHDISTRKSNPYNKKSNPYNTCNVQNTYMSKKPS
jgi:hypothetical protein